MQQQPNLNDPNSPFILHNYIRQPPSSSTVPAPTTSNFSINNVLGSPPQRIENPHTVLSSSTPSIRSTPIQPPSQSEYISGSVSSSANVVAEEDTKPEYPAIFGDSQLDGIVNSMRIKRQAYDSLCTLEKMRSKKPDEETDETQYDEAVRQLMTSPRHNSNKRKLISTEEKREMERIKKAKWRARKRDRDSDSHHFEIPFSELPRCVWDQIKRDFVLYSNGSAEDEGLVFLAMLQAIGFEWLRNGQFTKLPDPKIFSRLEDLELL